MVVYYPTEVRAANVDIKIISEIFLRKNKYIYH